MKKIFSVLLFLVVICQIRAEDTNITTMRKMTQRLFPQQASFFDFRLLNDTSTDSFTIKSEGNKIIISGNNANSMQEQTSLTGVQPKLSLHLKEHEGCKRLTIVGLWGRSEERRVGKEC